MNFMNPFLNRSAACLASAAGLGATATMLLLVARPVSAATTTPYTATGRVIGVPVSGIWCTNALGQVGFRGNAHLARVVSTDARLTGRRTIYVDGAAQADGSSIIYGPVYHEVGTWDAAGTNFTPTGGMWETTYRGTMGADGSLQLHIVGSGWGGTIDGLRLDETLTRVAGPNLDPAIPYQYTGTIKPPPVNTREVLDNFDTPPLTGWAQWLNGSSTVSESNQQFIATGYFPGMVTDSLAGTTWVGGISDRTWTVPDGRTLEWRADLVSLDENTTNVANLSVGGNSGLYVFHKGRDFAYVWKWSPTYGVSIFSCEKSAVRNTNIVLALALTRVEPNLVITARVLDKADPNTVLYQHSVVDTPNADPTLTTDQFQAVVGMRFLDLVPDGEEACFTSFSMLLGIEQWTDGKQPAARAIYDNAELWTSEVPPVAIERAVRVSWPASATIKYAVEVAPTVLGPWLPVQDVATPGLNQMTAPLNDLTEFFRLRQAP